MWRMSALPLRRCVATLWRKVWQVTCFFTPAFSPSAWTMPVEARAVELQPPAAARKRQARAGRAHELRSALGEVRLDRLGRGAS